MALKAKYGDEVEFIIVDLDQPGGQEMAQEFQVTSIPAFFFIDKKGELSHYKVGAGPQSEFEAQLDKLLK